MYPYIKLGGLLVPSYGLMLVCGVLMANVCAVFTCRRQNIADWQLWVTEGYAMLGGMVGAKLLYVFVSFDRIDWTAWRDPRNVNGLMSGGFVFYGGLAGGILACLIAGKIHRIPVARILSKVGYTLPLAHGFGRIGCLLAGCCYGVPYSGVAAVAYPLSPFGQNAGITYFPVQALEAACLWGLSLIVWKVSRKSAGYEPIVAYMAGYGILRFVLEFFRGDSARGTIGVLSVSQSISLVMAALAFLIFRRGSKTASV